MGSTKKEKEGVHLNLNSENNICWCLVQSTEASVGSIIDLLSDFYVKLNKKEPTLVCVKVLPKKFIQKQISKK